MVSTHGYRLCVLASGSLITDIFSCRTLINISCLHFGQNRGKFSRIVSPRILIRVLFLQTGHNIHLFSSIMAHLHYHFHKSYFLKTMRLNMSAIYLPGWYYPVTWCDLNALYATILDSISTTTEAIIIQCKGAKGWPKKIEFTSMCIRMTSGVFTALIGKTIRLSRTARSANVCFKIAGSTNTAKAIIRVEKGVFVTADSAAVSPAVNMPANHVNNNAKKRSCKLLMGISAP